MHYRYHTRACFTPVANSTRARSLSRAIWRGAVLGVCSLAVKASWRPSGAPVWVRALELCFGSLSSYSGVPYSMNEVPNALDEVGMRWQSNAKPGVVKRKPKVLEVRAHDGLAH